MTNDLSPRLQRILALGLLAAILLLGWAIIIDPFLHFISTRGDDREARLRALSRDHALLARDPKIKASLTAAAASPQWARLYDNDKLDQAVLHMETDLKELIATPNNPTSITAVPTVNKGLLSRIAVKVTLNMPIDQFAAFLTRLQAHPRLLQIDNLIIQAPDYQGANANPSLAIQAEIAGYLLSPGRAGLR